MNEAAKKIWNWCGTQQCWRANFYLHGFLIIAKATGLFSSGLIWINVFCFLLAIYNIREESPIE
jgi:hypothetical protein